MNKISRFNNPQEYAAAFFRANPRVPFLIIPAGGGNPIPARRVVHLRGEAANPFLADLGLAVTSGIGLGAGWTAAQHFTNRLVKKFDKWQKKRKSEKKDNPAGSFPSKLGPETAALNPIPGTATSDAVAPSKAPDPAAVGFNPISSLATEAKKKYREDVKAGHKAGQEYWAGYAGAAYLMSNPRLGHQGVFIIPNPRVGHPMGLDELGMNPVGHQGPFIIPNPGLGHQGVFIIPNPRGRAANLSYEVDQVRHVYCPVCLPDFQWIRAMQAAGRLKHFRTSTSLCEACGSSGRRRRRHNPTGQYPHQLGPTTYNPVGKVPQIIPRNPAEWPYPRSWMPASQLNPDARRNPFFGDMLTGLALGGGWTAAMIGVKEGYKAIKRRHRGKKEK